MLIEASRFQDALPSLGEVFTLITEKSAPRIYHAATHNMAYVVSETSRPGDFDKARAYARRARKCAGRGWSVPKAKLLWVEGKALFKSHFTPLAERRFTKALEVLKQFRAPFDVALVSLDLSVLYHQENRWSKLEELAKDTYRRFRELSADSEAIAALSLWSDSIMMRTLTEGVIVDVQARVESRMGHQSPPASDEAPISWETDSASSWPTLRGLDRKASSEHPADRTSARHTTSLGRYASLPHPVPSFGARSKTGATAHVFADFVIRFFLLS